MGDVRVPDLNQVIVCGRLTRDPELRYTQGGKAYCKAAIANTRYYRTPEGERRETTTFVDFTTWDKMAEFVGERLKKGRPVIVEGRLNTNEWDDRETGQKRRKLEVNAVRVVPLDWEEGGRPAGGGGSGGGYGGGAPAGGGSAPAAGGGRPAPRAIEEPIPEDDIPF